MPSGTIVKGVGGFYYVKVHEKVYECKARGIFRKNDITPLPGDRVNISIINGSACIGSIDEILPRDSELIRPAVANVDQVAAVIAIKSPAPDFMLLDKLLMTAECKNLTAIICINKIDLGTEQEIESIVNAYSKANYRVIQISSKENIGFESLNVILNGRITVFAGQSGVGKSTILNRIKNSSIMRTGDLSGKIERGKHTTRHAELVELESGGYVVDTPGFSSYEVSDMEYSELELYYPEFNDHLGRCRFTGCSHISEPDCSIKCAVENGFIDKSRYDRYTQLYNALKAIKKYKK